MVELRDEREWWPKEKREEYLVQGIRRISQHAYENAPAMRKKFDDAGFHPSQIRRLSDLEKIPQTSRDEIIKMQRDNPPFGGFQ